MRGKLVLAAASVTLITLSGSCSNNAQNIDHRHPLPVHCRRQVGATCIGATPGAELLSLERPAAGVNCFKGRHAANAAKPGETCFTGYLGLESEQDGRVTYKWRMAYRLDKVWFAVIADNPPKSRGWLRVQLVGYPVPPNQDPAHPEGWPFPSAQANANAARCEPARGTCPAVVQVQRMPGGRLYNSCLNNLPGSANMPAVFGACQKSPRQTSADLHYTYLVFKPGSALTYVWTTGDQGSIYCPVATHLVENAVLWNLSLTSGNKHAAQWHFRSARLTP